MTQLFNLSLAKADVPSVWKEALVIPLLKAGKPADEGSSFRPVSLLAPAAKILERVLLPFHTASLHHAPHHHGFTSLHSCTTALLPAVQQVAEGLCTEKANGDGGHQLF